MGFSFVFGLCFFYYLFIYLWLLIFPSLVFILGYIKKKKKTSLTGSLDRSRRMSFFHYFLLLNYFYVKTNNGVTLE